MTIEPRLSRVGRGMSPTKNPYEGRWGWWYSAIADQMLANPGIGLPELALVLNRGENTISMIRNTDSFRSYFAMRREQFTKDHDHAITSKLTRVTELALDATVEKLEKQRDKIDLPLLVDVMKSGLDRLGFAPKTGPAVVVNNLQDNRSVQLPGSVSLGALEEARFALRVSQEQRRGAHGKGAEPLRIDATAAEASSEAETVREVGDAPTSIDSQ